jgi:membrane-associated phospholipid phosphatase
MQGGEARSAAARPAGAPRTSPLLPSPGRRPAAVIAACCAVITAVFAVLAENRSRPDALDRPVDSWLHGHFGADGHALTPLSNLGGGLDSLLVTIIIVLACLAVRRLSGAVLAAVSALAVAGLIEFVLKHVVHETLNGDLVYPSGHTASVFAAATVITVLLLNPSRRVPRPAVTITVTAILALVSCLVGAAMISLNYHYFTDTIGGAAFAIAVVIAVTFLLDTAVVRRWLAAVPFLRPRPAQRLEADRQEAPAGQRAT